MKVYHDLESIDDAMRGAVLTVGNFDGVHLGHQRILRTAHALAQVSNAKVAAMTFEPHPMAILRPKNAPKTLTPWEEKLHQLERAGADAVVRIGTGAEILSLSAEDFVREVLVKRIHPSYIVEGPDFGFGCGRRGGNETLQEMSTKGGFQARVVEPYRISLSSGEHAVVSSTLVRECIKSGRVEDALRCLGRPYTLIGNVVHGAGDGRKLGYPTINIDVGRQLVPAEGVYSGYVELSHIRGPAAISVGHRPTLGGKALVIEAYVLDKSGDWYAQTARIELVGRLRDQKKFEDRDALTRQIARDIRAVRAMVT